jgi:hypothetical protein
MIAHKFFRSGARTLFTNLSWPLPAASGSAAWVEAGPGPLVPCRNGLHACRFEDLAHWIADELWEVELDAEWIRAPDALVARRARLVRRIEQWDAPETRAQFSQACLARAANSCASSAVPPASLAAQYLAQAKELAGQVHPVVVAYICALAFSAVEPTADPMTAFRRERHEQARLLATSVGLG